MIPSFPSTPGATQADYKAHLEEQISKNSRENAGKKGKGSALTDNRTYQKASILKAASHTDLQRYHFSSLEVANAHNATTCRW